MEREYPREVYDVLGDFQHIGLVTIVNLLWIMHASSATGCVTTDKKLGKWAYWGWLKDVAKADSLLASQTEPTEGDEEPMATTDIATVIADTGSKVNMRTKAKASTALVGRVTRLERRVALLEASDGAVG